MRPMTRRLAVLLAIFCASPLAAQDLPKSPARALSGPRVGFSILPPALVRRIKSDLDRTNVFPVISQFGWQSETDVVANATGGAAVVEGILLVGGIEQGMFLPSLSM